MSFTSATFNNLLKKGTNRWSKKPDWPLVFQICQLINENFVQPSYALDEIKKKLFSSNYCTASNALFILEMMMKNCGYLVQEEITTLSFCDTLQELVKTTPHPNVRQKLLELIQTWNFAFQKVSKYRSSLQNTMMLIQSNGFIFPPGNKIDFTFTAESRPEDGADACHYCNFRFGSLQLKNSCSVCDHLFCGRCFQRTDTLFRHKICDDCDIKPVVKEEKGLKVELTTEYNASNSDESNNEEKEGKSLHSVAIASQSGKVTQKKEEANGWQKSIMDFYTLTSDESAAELLKCCLCQNLLSYFPIHISINNENICGRCALPQGNTWLRNTAYEAVGQFLGFPCRYRSEGCADEVLPKDMPHHEKNCQFRIVNCPTTDCTHCDWEGSRPTLLQHCQEQHFDIILKNNEFEIDLSNSFEAISLLEHNSMLLIVRRKFDASENVLQCAVYNSQSETSIKNYSCRLNVRSSNRNVSVDFHTTNFDDVNFTELCLESLKDRSSNLCSVLVGRISVGEIIYDEERVNSDREKTNMDMLSVLKCSICSEFAAPPIFQCAREQATLCSECRPQHASSCSCTEGGREGRNVGLDKIASLLNYPCRNRRNGCTFASKPDQIGRHEGCCPHGESECPIFEYVKCDWKGLAKDVKAHVEDRHDDLILTSAEVVKHLISRRMYCNMIRYANRLFRLVYVEIDRRFYWAVQVVGSFEKSFKYEIEMVDKTNCGERLVVKQSCGPLMKRKQILKDDKYYCYLHADQIKRIVPSRNTIAFKVHIFYS